MLSLEFSFSLLIVHSPAHHNCLNSVYVYFKLKEFLFEHISRSLLKFCGWKKIYILWKYWQCCKLFGILGKILLLFKKFNRVFFSIYNCKKFRIVLQKNQMLLLLFITISIIVLHDYIQPECSSHKGVCLKNKMKWKKFHCPSTTWK